MRWPRRAIDRQAGSGREDDCQGSSWLEADIEPSEELRRELLAFAAAGMGAAVAPREIEFVRFGARNRSGKIMRRLLKAGAGATGRRHLDAGAGVVTLEREHGLELLRQMLRVRRFEEKCVEMYSATKIRGFMHLYIARRRFAVGTMQALGPDDAIVATTASTATRSCVVSQPGRSWRRCTARSRVALAVAEARCICSTPRPDYMAVNAIVGRRAAAGGRSGASGQASGRERVTACFFGDGAVAEGEFSRVHEPRGAVEPARCCSAVRTTCTRWAPRSSATSPRPISLSRRPVMR